MKNNLHLRNRYIEKLNEYHDNGNVKLITGMRGSGKSSIIRYYIEQLIETGVKRESIIYINFEQNEGKKIKDSLKMYYFLQKQLIFPGKKYLFLDEVTNIDRFERSINLLFDDKSIDIYLVSSNLGLLSDELKGFLSNKISHIHVLTLSFKEYLYFNNLSFIDNLDSSFKNYLKYGGLPKLYEYNYDDEKISDYQNGNYSLIIVKDILKRNLIGEFKTLDSILEVICNYIGENTSPHKIGVLIGDKKSGYITKRTPASRTVESHIDMLNRAFLIDEVKRVDIKTSKQLKTLGKYYINDISLLNYVSVFKTITKKTLLENVIYNELKRRNYSIKNGKFGERSIDFVVTNGKSNSYIQIIENLNDKKELKKALSPLSDLSDSENKILIYYKFQNNKDDFIFNTLSNLNIKSFNIINFLLDR